MSGVRVIHADLVLVNLVGKTPEESIRIGRGQREHPKKLEDRDEQVGENDWVCYYDDGSNQLEALLARLLSRTPG